MLRGKCFAACCSQLLGWAERQRQQAEGGGGLRPNRRTVQIALQDSLHLRNVASQVRPITQVALLERQVRQRLQVARLQGEHGFHAFHSLLFKPHAAQHIGQQRMPTHQMGLQGQSTQQHWHGVLRTLHFAQHAGVLQHGAGLSAACGFHRSQRLRRFGVAVQAGQTFAQQMLRGVVLWRQLQGLTRGGHGGFKVSVVAQRVGQVGPVQRVSRAGCRGLKEGGLCRTPASLARRLGPALPGLMPATGGRGGGGGGGSECRMAT